MRELSPGIQVEILVPDFRGKGRMERALDLLAEAPPDVFNHNLETVQPLYRDVRPGADYQWSLSLLQKFKARHLLTGEFNVHVFLPDALTLKSGSVGNGDRNLGHRDLQSPHLDSLGYDVIVIDR